MITLYLVRHGEAECNVLCVASSLPETTERHLTEKGREQIARVAESLVGKKVDGIIASPLVRTQETARIISEKISIPVQTDDRLHETGFGIFNERPIKLFFEKYPHPDMRISPDPTDGVESYIDMRGRLTTFLDDVKERYAGKAIVIVSHGDPLEQLHGILTNEAPGQSATGWYPEKGSCTEVVWKGV
jgi:probable phosphoglycerate mutase